MNTVMENVSASLCGTEIFYLNVDDIAQNPYQPRRVFNRESLEELAGSIREYGVMQPVTVRLINGSRYELVSGERRLRASRMAGLGFIPAVVVDISDKDSAILALIENLQRENLNFFDEAEGYRNLIGDYGFTQDELALRIGKTQSTVANKIRVLRLPEEARDIIIKHNLTERHARAVLPILNREGGNEELMNILAEVVTRELTVKATELLVQARTANDIKQKKVKKGNQKIKAYIKDMRVLRNTIAQTVDMIKNSGLDTAYDFEENEDGCFISIIVSY